MFGARYEYIDNYFRSTASSGVTTEREEDMFAFAPGGGLVYNHDNNWQWFAGVYKGFNIPGPQLLGTTQTTETQLSRKLALPKKLE